MEVALKDDAKFIKLQGLHSAKKITRKSVAIYLGLYYRTYLKKLNGESEFTLNEIVKLMNLFNATFEDIFLN